MILTKAEYIALVNSLLPDNSSQLISPADVRTSLFSLVDSVHNFLSGQILNTATISDIDVRTVRAGRLSIEKYNYPGRYNEDNSAFGYYSLGGNYNGISNTALGSYAISCNLYGSHNVGVGYNSLAGNITGSGNVGIGNHTLQSNKHGDFNIAIGHGAGYYIGENQNYKLYIGAHDIDPEILCDPLLQSGMALIHGDLKNIRLGIGTNTLDSIGKLQVNGTITPIRNFNGSLGHPSQQWSHLYLSSGIGYSGGFYIGHLKEPFPSQYEIDKLIYINSQNNIGIGTSSPLNTLLTINGDVLPKITNTYTLGNEEYRWNGFFNDVFISGNAVINNFTSKTMESCIYNCKTLHLASSGICEDGDITFNNSDVCGYLTNQELEGAGFEAHASGDDYINTYKFIYKFPDPTLNCISDNHYTRSRWFSNTSIELESGKVLISDKILSRDNLSLITNSGCYGFFIRPGTLYPRIFIGNENAISHLNNNQVNFLFPTGFSVNYKSENSNLNISQDFISRGNSANYRGFKLKYYDTNDSLTCGQISDRFAVVSIDNASLYEPVTILRNHGYYQSGVFGITNIVGTSILPRTIFNVQAESGCEIRFSSKQLNPTKLQLLSNGNAPYSGVQITYNPVIGSIDNSFSTDINVDFSLLFPGGTSNKCGTETPTEESFMSVAVNGFIGIGKTKSNNTRIFTPNAPLTIFHDGLYDKGTISLHEQDYSPSFTSDYGKLYVKPNYIQGFQSQSLYFLDDNGHEFNLIVPPSDDNSLYTDDNENTYGGRDCPYTRPSISAFSNTAIGHSALYSITTGSRNVTIGHGAGAGITTGNDNIILGKHAARLFTSALGNTIIGSESLFLASNNGTGNVILGYKNLYSSSSNPVNTILIGTGLYYSSNIPDNTLSIGFGSNPLVSGNLSSNVNNRFFTISESKFSTTSQSNEQQFIIDHALESSKYVTSIKIKDNINSNTNDGFLSLRFLDKNDKSRTLMNFNHAADSMSITPNFTTAVPARPYVSISGDLRILGSIRFSDGTSFSTSTIDFPEFPPLDFASLPNALDTTEEITYYNSYLALSVPNDGSVDNDQANYVGKINLSDFADLMINAYSSGNATVGFWCNHVFTNPENVIKTRINDKSIFIGCNVGLNATGWKHAIMIGSEAGYGATSVNDYIVYGSTPYGLQTENAPIFIGYRAGYDADNTNNSVFIGATAGKGSKNSLSSIFIGKNAGNSASYQNSIGIGENALRCNEFSSTIETGIKNIEIVAGLQDNERLFSNRSPVISNKLNIQNTIAGDTGQGRISIGSATLDPDAALSVIKTTIKHGSLKYIQTWKCDDSQVAAVGCGGEFYQKSSDNILLESILEGTTEDILQAPTNLGESTWVWFQPKDESWTNRGSAIKVYNKNPNIAVPSGKYMIAQMINGNYRAIRSSGTVL